MVSILKVLITIAIGVFMLIGGYYAYVFLNRKIRESVGMLDLLAYSVLLLAALGILYFGGLYVMIKVYNFFAASE